MRSLAVISLAGGFFVLGVCGAHRLKCRVRELRDIITGLEAMKRELKYSLAPLSVLLRCAAEQTSGGIKTFFDGCACGVEAENGDTFRSVFQKALEQCSLCLWQDDLLILRQLGGVLGSYDADEQIKVLENTAARLEQQYQKSVEECARLGKLSVVLGVTAGMFAVILLI